MAPNSQYHKFNDTEKALLLEKYECPVWKTEERGINGYECFRWWGGQLWRNPLPPALQHCGPPCVPRHRPADPSAALQLSFLHLEYSSGHKGPPALRARSLISGATPTPHPRFHHHHPPQVPLGHVAGAGL